MPILFLYAMAGFDTLKMYFARNKKLSSPETDNYKPPRTNKPLDFSKQFSYESLPSKQEVPRQKK
jgi:hypothetical protein